jgi:L-cystine uptake protein TcyP (sodium:dicarboxylate symporter family)
LTPGARRGYQNHNRNDIAHVNLGLFAVMKPVDTSNKVGNISVLKIFVISSFVALCLPVAIAAIYLQ